MDGTASAGRTAAVTPRHPAPAAAVAALATAAAPAPRTLAAGADTAVETVAGTAAGSDPSGWTSMVRLPALITASSWRTSPQV